MLLANIMPVIASNRIGTEKDEIHNTELTFYGSSFITDETGAKIAEANRTDETVLVAEFDLDAIAQTPPVAYIATAVRKCIRHY